MNAEIKPTKHSAPGQYLGFALQPVRAFFHLLTAPNGAKVALELQDDVSVHRHDGSVCLEQTKSALKQNPISDWDEDLWKAFDNWRVMLDAGQCDAASTTFRLYVTPAKSGAFAEALAAAKTDQEVDAALAVIKTKLGKKKTPPAVAPKVQALLELPTTSGMVFFEISNWRQMQTILWKSLGIVFGHPSPNAISTSSSVRG